MRNKLTKFLTSECPPKGMRQFAKTWKYTACMLLAFILGIGQIWGANGDVLFTQDFSGVTPLAYRYTSGTVTETYSYSASGTTLSGLVGTGANLFTSLESSVKKGDIAINSATGGNNVDATGIFRVYSNGDNATQYSLVRSANLATTAPTALKVTFDIKFKNLSSGSNPGVSFAIGSGFTDNSLSLENKSNVHSGFSIVQGSTPYLVVYSTTTKFTGNPSITSDKWMSVVWVINNTGDKLKYDNPTGSGQTELNNDCFDLWIKQTSAEATTYTRIVSNQAANTPAKDLQNIFIGNAEKKKHELGLDNIVVTDLSPAAASKYHVTYALNGGTGTTPTQADVAEGAKFTLHDGTTGITAPENKEFAGWNDGTTTFNGGAEYTMGSSNVTLTAQWQNIATKYAITYDLNGASGDAPTEASKAEGASFNLAAAPSRDGYRFDGWLCNIDGLVKAAESSYTMTAAATTFTAQWTQLFTVTYYNGAVSLGTEQVANGGSPANYGSFQTLPLASFVGWYSDQELNTAIADVSALTISANTPIYGKWNKAYAESIDFISVAGDYVDQLAAKNYALNCSDMTKVSYDNNANAYDKGLKIKKNGTTLSFNVAAGKVVEITTGIISGATLSVNGGAAEDLTITAKSDASIKTRAYYSVGEQSFVIATTTDSYCIFKSIAIHDPYVVTYDATTNGGDAVDPASATYIGTALTLPSATKGTENFLGWYDAATDGTKIGVAGDSYTPTASITLYAQFEAISTDARLSAITFSAAGTLSPAFDPEVVNYTYTMPYGTTAVPTITGATKANVKGQEPVIDAQASAWGETAQVHGVAESGDTKNYFVTMKLGPKDGVCLVWGDIPSNNTITYNATNSKVYKAADVTLATTVSGKDGAAPSGVKFQNNSYVKVALNEGTFKAGDVLALDVTYGTANKMYVYNAQAAAAENVIGELDGTTTPAGVNKVAITDDAAELWLVRAGQSGSWNPHVDYVAVYRIMNPMLTAITINGEAGTINESAKTVAVELQPGYDLAALTIVPTIVSNTDEASVVKTVESNGGAWVIGDNTYRLTDKDGDYTEYTITLSVGEVKHIVSFNTHGGSTIDPVQVVDGQKLAAAPADPTKDDYIFQGWSETDGGSIVDVTSYTISDDKEFHAVWASDGAIKLLDGATVNHTNFITGVTADETVEFMGNTVNYAKFAGTCGNVNNVKDLTKSIIYNATTNKTKIQISAHNNSTSGRNIYVIGLVEGASEAVELANISLGNKEDKVSDWIEFDNAANRTIYIMVPSSAGDVYFTQVKVIESGETPMKQAGETGYSLNFNKGRFFGIKDNIIAFEGLNVGIASSDCQPLNTSIVKLNNTSMSFTVASAMTLSVTTNNNKTYYVTEGAAGTDNETAKTGVSEFNLTAGTWYITAGASNVEITNIAFSAPKCAEPEFNALANSDLCEGAAFEALNGTATVGDAGTPIYQWYKADGDVEIEGATSATYTPTADGSYYVVATNQLAGYSDNSKKSNTVSVTHFASAVITTAPLNQRGLKDAEVTLSVAATGKNLSYEWFTCDNEAGENPVAVVPAATGTSLSVTITEGMNQWYKVVVSSDCGSASATAKVEQFVPATPANVTESIVWDWTSAAWPASGEVQFTDKTEDGTDLTPAYELLADADAIVPNNAAFRSDMLYGKGQYVWRSGNKFFQGTAIKFTTEVAGRVRVYYRSTGNNKHIQVKINGTLAGTYETGDFRWSDYVDVPVGDVEIICTSTDANKSYTRIQKIEFQTPSYVRTEMLGNGVYGTICVDHNVPEGGVRGVTVYEIAGREPQYGKIAFDEVTEMEAGVPYVFIAHGNEMALYYGETKVDNPVNGNGMYGTFTAQTLTDLDGIYYFAKSALWSCVDLTSLNLPANRAYVKLSEIDYLSDPNPAPGRKRILLGVNGQNATTDLGNVQGDEVQSTKVLINGQLYIFRGEKMYNANGQLVK